MNKPLKEKEPIFYTRTGFGVKRVSKGWVRKNWKTLKQVARQGKK